MGRRGVRNNEDGITSHRGRHEGGNRGHFASGPQCKWSVDVQM